MFQVKEASPLANTLSDHTPCSCFSGGREQVFNKITLLFGGLLGNTAGINSMFKLGDLDCNDGPDGGASACKPPVAAILHQIGFQTAGIAFSSDVRPFIRFDSHIAAHLPEETQTLEVVSGYMAIGGASKNNNPNPNTDADLNWM